jgi:transposase-like protein
MGELMEKWKDNTFPKCKYCNTRMEYEEYNGKVRDVNSFVCLNCGWKYQREYIH